MQEIINDLLGEVAPFDPEEIERRMTETYELKTVKDKEKLKEGKKFKNFNQEYMERSNTRIVKTPCHGASKRKKRRKKRRGEND